MSWSWEPFYFQKFNFASLCRGFGQKMDTCNIYRTFDFLQLRTVFFLKVRCAERIVTKKLRVCLKSSTFLRQTIQCIMVQLLLLACHATVLGQQFFFFGCSVSFYEFNKNDFISIRIGIACR